MIEITTKYNDICNCSDVELKDVFDYCKNRMNDFLKNCYGDMHITLHFGKRDLLISYMRYSRYSFYYNGIGYTYRNRLKGLKDAVTMFINFVEHDANIKRT